MDDVKAGEVALPARPVPEPFVDADDIAEAAVAALTDDRHKDMLYEVTGPRALTFREAVDAIAAATGRSIRFRQPSTEEFVAAMQPCVPQDAIDRMLELFTVVLDGRNAQVMHGVEGVLGRPCVRLFRLYPSHDRGRRLGGQA